MYLLDEPTTGLHWLDVQKLMDLLFRLRDGNTLVVTEHNLDVIRLADHVVEIGPERWGKRRKASLRGISRRTIKQKTNTGIFLCRHNDQLAISKS